jgi:hypothetical protein
MRKLAWVLAVQIGAALTVAGCGFYVPEIQDIPNTPEDAQLLVQAIVTSVHCEIANAVRDVIDTDIKLSKLYKQPRYTKWFESWGAQVALTLTLEEKSALTPNAVWTPPSQPSQIFTLGAAAGISADATRTDTTNFYYTVPALYKRAYCATGVHMGHSTSLLLQSDLKLKEWLLDQFSTVATGEVTPPSDPSGPLARNVISHEVKFVVSTSGSITPAWTLVAATINQTPPLFAGNRDRTHDLTITFGPDHAGGLAQPAADAHLAKLIGLSVSTNLQPLLLGR